MSSPPEGAVLSDRGHHRVVHEHALDEGLVVKRARPDKEFVNLLEWAMWRLMERRGLSEWLAPAVSCCPNGEWLVMERTEPIKDSDVPQERPDWFTDTKVPNWGRLGERVVLHDYHQLASHWRDFG